MKKQYAVLVFFAGLITFLYSACQKNKISTEFYIKYSPNTKVGDSIYVEAASDFSGIKYFWTFGDGSTSHWQSGISCVYGQWNLYNYTDDK